MNYFRNIGISSELFNALVLGSVLSSEGKYDDRNDDNLRKIKKNILMLLYMQCARKNSLIRDKFMSYNSLINDAIDDDLFFSTLPVIENKLSVNQVRCIGNNRFLDSIKQDMFIKNVD